ncbi:MAG: TerD domain-containing protein [Gracilibacteraceae bacterium]|jgi:tellurite resistance protein TerA|nr:TerD domain-containing protein [Gracilibacteraceae bacterium]
MELQKGQKTKIADLTQARQLELAVDAPMGKGTADVVCFAVDANNRLSDDRYFIFYNQEASPEQAIRAKTQGARTVFSLDTGQVPAFISKLVFAVAAEDGAAVRDLGAARLTLSAGSAELCGFSFAGSNFQAEKAIIICELYRKDNIWRLAVVADGFNGGLSALLAHFGGEEVAPARPAPPPPAPNRPAPAPPPAPVPPPVPTPPPAPALSTGPINLKKSGDSHKINLSKNASRLHFNLNWNAGKKSFFGGGGIDLDLACMYRLKGGQQGVIQALGNSFGSENSSPFIRLDQDDRSGASQGGENMIFHKPELVEFAVVFAYIYEGVANWRSTDAIVTIKQQGAPDIVIHIDNSNSRERFCVIAGLRSLGDQLEVKREEKFFQGHREVDQHYGFGFRWQAGRK